MKIFLSAVVILSFFNVANANAAGTYRPKVIYGDDNRLDYYQVTDSRLQTLSDSTVALIRGTDLTKVAGQSNYSYDPTTFGQSFSLCKSEPFTEQPSAAFCSGFLVGKNLIATAGHCIRTASDCSGTKFVFGYKLSGAGVNPTTVSENEIYSCSKVVHSIVEMAGKDFAIVQLDRDVVGHEPLTVRRSGALQVGDGITVMGYPSGIPLKIAGGANVRRLETGYFVANLDTYGGNSGSAVFNSTSGEVEGILVRGETDFVSQGSCRVSKRCTNTDCRGEDVTLISETLAHIPVAGSTPLPQLPTRLTFTSATSVAIPDNTSKGVTSTVTASEAPRGRKVKVKLDIAHTYRGDLKVVLVAPGGKEVILSNRAGRSEQNLVGTFGDGEAFAASGLTGLSSVVNAGVWTLKVSDNARRDTGTLKSWTLIFE